MKPLIIALVVNIVLLSSPAPSEDDVTLLKLIKALPVEGPENNQPSGLTIFNDTLFAVSDKHDDTIFRIELRDNKAVFRPYLTFELSEPVAAKRLDFEGIACDEEGHFYLVSETAFRILRISADGEEASWVTPSLRSYGENEGLFQTRGAYLEGIALLDRDTFLVCAERQPRGLIEVDMNVEPYAIRVFNTDETRLKLPAGRNSDFADLFRENRDLYVIQRNADAICKLVYGGQVLEEKDIWSYTHIVNREDLHYSSMRFGKAEGLCMDEEHIYLILDNNGDHRASNPEDRRPLLLIMERP